MEAVKESEKRTKKQLDDTENERRQLEQALNTARDELDSVYEEINALFFFLFYSFCFIRIVVIRKSRQNLHFYRKFQE